MNDSFLLFVLALSPLLAATEHPLAFTAVVVASTAACWAVSRALAGKLYWTVLIGGTLAAVWAGSVVIVWLLGMPPLWGRC